MLHALFADTLIARIIYKNIFRANFASLKRHIKKPQEMLPVAFK